MILTCLIPFLTASTYLSMQYYFLSASLEQNQDKHHLPHIKHKLQNMILVFPKNVKEAGKKRYLIYIAKLLSGNTL